MRLPLTKKFIKNIVNGKWQIYDEDNENIYVYYTQMSFTYSYNEYYFCNEDKSFRLKDYKVKWFVSKK